MIGCCRRCGKLEETTEEDAAAPGYLCVACFKWLRAEPDQGMSCVNPKCPKCGSTMTGGAPHGPWPVQWECHRCGTVVVPSR